MRRIGVVLAATWLWGCGPSEEEKRACETKKRAAGEAWAAYGKALAGESESIRAVGKRLSEAAERRAVAEGAAGPPDPAQVAAARSKAAPRIAHADARRAYAHAVESAAAQAEAVGNAYSNRVMEGIEAEAGASARFEEVASAATRVGETARGLASGDEGGAPPSTTLSGLRTSAQEAGQAALAACEKIERE